jgi:hypothetical protein
MKTIKSVSYVMYILPKFQKLPTYEQKLSITIQSLRGIWVSSHTYMERSFPWSST